jgi:hypothetical protein
LRCRSLDDIYKTRWPGATFCPEDIGSDFFHLLKNMITPELKAFMGEEADGMSLPRLINP